MNFINENSDKPSPYTQRSYSLFYRRLHWSLMMIILILLLAGQQFNFDLTEMYRINGLRAHSTLGSLSLVIVLLFIYRRFIKKAPVPKVRLPWLKKILAKSVQISLYGIAIVIPVTGLLSAQYSPFPVYLLGIIDISYLNNPDTFIYLRSIHCWSTRLVMFLFAAHAGAALYHHFILNDLVLKSMLVKDPALTRLWLFTKNKIKMVMNFS